jgi:hypothetical protein
VPRRRPREDRAALQRVVVYPPDGRGEVEYPLAFRQRIGPELSFTPVFKDIGSWPWKSQGSEAQEMVMERRMWCGFHTSRVSSRWRRFHSAVSHGGRALVATLVLGVLPACEGCGARAESPTEAGQATPTVPVSSLWNAVPAQASAWVVVDLARLRADGRFDSLLSTALPTSGPQNDGQLGQALSYANRVLFAASDAFFSDRFHVLEGTWDGAALGAELESGEGVASEGMTEQALGRGTLWSAPSLPWAVAWDGGALLATGPPSALQLAFPPRPERTAPDWVGDAMLTAAWTPPSLVRGILADRIDRPELAEPIRALRNARLTVSAGAGLDMHLELHFANADQVEPGRAALEALVAIFALEFVDAPLTESLRGLTFESRATDSALDVWWQIDRASLRTWLGLVENLAADGGRHDTDHLAQEP